MALSINTNSRGTDVTRLQQALASRGFNPQGIDGAFGRNTRAAVIAFQRAQGITRTASSVPTPRSGSSARATRSTSMA